MYNVFEVNKRCLYKFNGSRNYLFILFILFTYLYENSLAPWVSGYVMTTEQEISCSILENAMNFSLVQYYSVYARMSCSCVSLSFINVM